MATSNNQLHTTIYEVEEEEDSESIESLDEEEFVMMRPVTKARLSQPLDATVECVSIPALSSGNSKVSHVPMRPIEGPFSLSSIFWTPPPTATSLAQVAKEYLRISERPRPALRGRPGPFIHAIYEEEETPFIYMKPTIGHPMVRTKGKKGTPRRPKARMLPDENVS